MILSQINYCNAARNKEHNNPSQVNPAIPVIVSIATNLLKKTNSKTPLRCSECGQSSTYRSRLLSHIRTHTGEKPFKCDICDKAFGQSRGLVAHKRTHTGEKPFSCDICDKAFGRPRGLVAHKRTHTGEKPFKCDVCDKAFSQSGNLREHKITHTGEKRFKCINSGCLKAYTTKKNLGDHKKKCLLSDALNGL